MSWGLGNLFDPAGVFSGDKGDVVNNLLDPVGGMMQNFDIGQGSDYGNLHENIGNWMDDMADTNSVVAQNRWKAFKDNPERIAYAGGDLYGAASPAGTKVTNKVFGTDYAPITTTIGDATQQDLNDAENRGINTSNFRGANGTASTIGRTIGNYYTGGLAGTAVDALDNYGYDKSNDELFKNAAKNYAKNYALNGISDYAGANLPETGGYSEQGGGYVSNNDYGGTGGFNLGKSLGATDSAPLINSVAKGAVTNGLSTAANGGNSTNIGQSLLKGGISNGVKPGASMIGNYFNNNNDEMPDTGTLGGTMSDMFGENSSTLGGETTPTQAAANSQATSTGFLPSNMNLGGPTEKAASAGDHVSDFLSAILPSSGGGKAGSFGNYGDLASSMFGMYNAYKQKKALQEQQQGLQNLFSPNSPYAQMARQRMERQDAAAGRRSQYGNRETQLAALLADKQASTYPQQNKYAGEIGGFNNAMANTGLRGVGQLWQMYHPQPRMNFQGNSGMGPRTGDNDYGVY